ncbi:UDP-N-acetylmuramoylalanine--D-glutamate ligase [Pseudidiomarina planktonica]|uniref:UDP-N-acetylmuramoylalanine--D-glutamate ligase n=1 Tax=Pseudidiomarina planktonica TaxID=1323738 RepID=A0A1Y6EDU9_9GAMM|nr:UDP-N-acetylmuramoyl-L-alanine--D-glutamate ligase [Pseudidiomarina planktonica]SMQ60747.1 UDP-N-acetylmuramoylalanine--D-glutamate ligase [Pseudidiomarina planktonica]
MVIRSAMKQLQEYKEVAVIGLGQTGLSCVRFLLNQDVRPEVFDSHDQPKGLAELHKLDKDLLVHTGPFEIEHLLAMDLLIISPGVDREQLPLQIAADAGIPIIGDIELFAWQVTRPVIAITGSNGKSTVTKLCGDLIASTGKRVAVGGNIGVPVLDLVNQDVDCYVLELSSFQLESTSSLAPVAATILNVSADHLDRYLDLHAYVDAKQRIYRHAEHLVVNRDDSLTQPTQRLRDSNILSFGESAHDQDYAIKGRGDKLAITRANKTVVKASELQLQGVHNLTNVQAALALLEAIHITPQEVLPALREFVGLPHRCELILEHNGVRWINDSKATNVGAAQAAIQGLRGTTAGQLVLLAGGDGKGADFRSFSDALQQVDTLITFGRDGDRIADLRPDSIRVKTLEEAVASAAKAAGKQGTVLLSPACASFDMFNNFEHRGHMFRQAVEAHYAKLAS